ncbi:hypothetical protein ACFQ6U_01705 [Streptomyces sp. NPDC056465]|uniref:hypothetical protein n=1 Tax=Streptomyces sp. NPDC056465 TaxID=3345829 RepID=UPI00367D9351
MVYAISLSAAELDDIDWQLQLDQFMGKTMGSSMRPRDLSPQVTLVLARTHPTTGSTHPTYQLRWLGVVKRPKGKRVATRDALIRVEPLWRSPAPVELATVAASLSRADVADLTLMLSSEVAVLPDELGQRLVAALREQGSRFAELLDRLTSVADQAASTVPSPRTAPGRSNTTLRALHSPSASFLSPLSAHGSVRRIATTPTSPG